jgi:hypothetical protein
MTEIFQVPFHICPVCNMSMDMVAEVSHLDGEPPKEGDLTICTYCSAVSVFKADQTVRLATSKELESLPESVLKFLMSQDKQ